MVPIQAETFIFGIFGHPMRKTFLTLVPLLQLKLTAKNEQFILFSPMTMCVGADSRLHFECANIMGILIFIIARVCLNYIHIYVRT